ncbi:MAG: DUF4038 domain-containing protein [Clostridia bacterium]|nr:DUF4038 domain-containing protein [Clostridia bacterium]
MRRLIKTVMLMLFAAVMLPALSCEKKGGGDDQKPGKPDVDNVVPPEPQEREDITEETDYKTLTWVAADITFETESAYEKNTQLYVEFYGDFTNRETKTKLTIPGFWNGENTFVLRFAPTEYGIWDFTTRCDTDRSLNGKKGTVAANQYKGDLEIYKRGFVTTNGSKHFVYADGTPFFYLGDTHWGMYTEEINRGGAHAGDTGAGSHFKYIVDKRAEQGFTVYQSEPIGTGADLTDGTLSAGDVRAFIRNDEYYKYIAEKGLVHANAEFFFAGQMNEKVMNDKSYMEAISRYWVARYAAYPVMWTLAQEIDSSFYASRGDQKLYTAANNPWVLIAEYIHKYDAYSHPLSGHQENASFTTVTGLGTTEKGTNDGKSVFLSDEVSARTGHNWWAVQWSPSLTGSVNTDVVKDYWQSSKVAINYEGRYCYLWTKNFGARAQSWISMLSGFSGVGYGAIDMWLYNSNYDVNSTSSDGIDKITPEDKAVHWSEAVEFESAYQHGYMRSFFEQFKWWELTPDFDSRTFFIPDSSEPLNVSAAIPGDLYIVYFYSRGNASGSVAGLYPGETYEAKWFNPRTNEYTDIGTFVAPGKDAAGNSVWKAPDRPAFTDGTDKVKDVVLLVKRIEAD